ncbi:hypothetical protein OY671_007734, partial [Metschnikowia pulcherrima]
MPNGGGGTTCEDITERSRAEARIAHMAMHDDLTGLPNRASFNHWSDRESESAESRDEQVASAIIDLDRFKEINDTQGHVAGDMSSQRIADAMSAASGDGETVARIGGDEFAAAKHFSSPAESSDFVARSSRCFDIPFGAQDGIAVGASLGIAIYPTDATGREASLNNADLAMYRAKGNSGERICYYEQGMDESARHRRLSANDSRHAVARGELAVSYQPQHSLKNGEISGYEASLRWHHPRFGIVSPVEFIPIAEENGEIMKSGEWVLRMACAEAVFWPQKHKIAVNLSPVQLLQADSPEIVTRVSVETGLSPQRLESEITETASIADKVRSSHTSRRIKASGVSVAMDDFGTGYSSSDTSHSFPFDKIKIDRSFVRDLGSNQDAQAIVRSIISLGMGLGVTITAEGVETECELACSR